MDEPTPHRWPEKVGAALASRWVLPLLAIAAFAISLLVQHFVYPWLSWNRDEPVYLWQVDVLRSGQLSTSDGGHPHLFQPWLSAAQDGRLFSQYTLGWPLVLLVGSLLGSTELAVAAGTSLAVVGTWLFVNEVMRDRVAAAVAGLAMLGSPILAVQGGMHLNYLFTLGLGLLFATALLRGVRHRSTALLLAAGALLGWVFLTRPFDALVWGLVGAVPVLIEHRRHARRLLGAAAWVAVTLVPLVVVTFALNKRLTGSATEFPITVADPLDQFGFGVRRLMPSQETVPYGRRLALSSSSRNTFWFPFFVVGAHLGVLVAAFGVWAGRRRAGVWMLVGLGVAFPLAYVAFFGTHISSLFARLSGPIYYVPAYTAMCGLIAVGLVHLGRRRPAIAVGVALLLVAVTVPVTASRLTVNRDLSRANRPWADSLDAVHGPAIIVPSPPAYLLFVNPYGDNGADFDGRLLFASDRPELLDLLAEQPGRPAYLQRADISVVDLLPSEDTETPNVSLTPLEVLDGAVHLVGDVDEVDGPTSTAWWVEADGAVVGRPTPVDGTAAIDVDLTDIGLVDGLHTINIVVGAGDSAAKAVKSPRARRTFYVRSRGDTVEVLAPGTASIHRRREGAPKAEWEDALTAPGLEIDAVLPDDR